MATETRTVPASKTSPECCCDYFFQYSIPSVSYPPVCCGLETGTLYGKLFAFESLFSSTILSSVAYTTGNQYFPRGAGKINDSGGSVWGATGTPTDDSLYLQSGRWTSTIRDSINLNASVTNCTGVEWDGTNTPYAGTQNGGANWGLWLFSGQFSSTIKSSLLYVSAANISAGVSYDAPDSPWILPQSGANSSKFVLQSGQFESTVKTSLIITDAQAPGGGVGSGISDYSPDTVWCINSPPRLIYQSGQFTSTVKSSLNNSGDVDQDQDISL